MNHEELLRKYIRHVVDRDGVDHVDSLVRDDAPLYEHNAESVRFSEDEIAELERITAAA